MQSKTQIGDHKAGQIVFISSKSKKGSVLVLHTPFGEELDARDAAQTTTSEKLWMLGARCMTRREVEAFRKKLGKSRVMGHWFKRSAAIDRAVQTINAEADRAYRTEMKRAA